MMRWQLQSKIKVLRKKEKKKVVCCYRENNIDESKIVFVHGRIEDVTLPVDKVKNRFYEYKKLFFIFLKG